MKYWYGTPWSKNHQAMTRIILTLFVQVLTLSLFAHAGGHETPSQSWSLQDGKEVLLADFVSYEDGTVLLTTDQHKMIKRDITEFSAADQQYILRTSNWIQAANHAPATKSDAGFLPSSGWLLLLGALLVLFAITRVKKWGQPVNLAYGLIAFALVFVACESSKSASGTQEVLGTKVPASDLTFLQSVFSSFDEVTTRSDDKYFYIESNGIPNHEMMTGITSWQQQVPIPHEYSGDNSWAIPLQPQIAASPMSTKTNFMKGAIAVAANGIPIFNPLNNRGEDANAIGELDNWGGHCGRADDYHYHLVPTHLQEVVGAGKPIAFALDGFPVYGETTKQLDEYLGRFNADSSYEYHAVKDYPYLIAGMRGKVEINPQTSAPENEISPQAKTRGVRPDLRPLRGASITGFEQTQPQQYELTYTVDDQTYRVNYGWDDGGLYTFEFVSPDGSSETSEYQRK